MFGKEVKKMKEALERLQNAEKENDHRKNILLEELQAYEMEKKQLLQEERQLLKEELAAVAKEKERAEQAKLLQEKEELQQKNDQLTAQLNEQYDKNSQEAVAAIIERVKETYGCN